MRAVAALLLLFFASPLLASERVASEQVASEQALIQEARQWVKAFASELKPRLQQAMQEGGPTHAIAVCSQQAPQIAQRLSATSGWTIKRVSLKPRNLATATPDNWERQVLQQFEQRLSDGEPAAQMYEARLEQDSFRYMQPQIVEGICLTCHGEKLAPAVSEQLQRYAPGDTATGYQLGQIRGAFSLTKVLDTH